MLRLTDARTGAKTALEPQPNARRIQIGVTGADFPTDRRTAITADLLAAAMTLSGLQPLPLDDRNPPSIWVGASPGAPEALWVRPGSVTGEYGAIDDSTWRLICLQHHYRLPIEVRAETRTGARRAALRLQRAYKRLVREAPGGTPLPELSIQAERFRGQIHAALLDDLATPEALAVLWQLLDHDVPPGEQLALLFETDRLLGLGIG